jgi:hypothetical protein
MNDLNILNRTAIAMYYIGQISDKTERDAAIKDLVKNLYTQPLPTKIKK